MTWDGEYFPRQFGQPKSVNSRRLGHQARHREATGLIFQHATSPVIVKNEIFSSPPQYTFSVGPKIKFCDVKTSSKPRTVNSTQCMKMIFRN